MPCMITACSAMSDAPAGSQQSGEDRPGAGLRIVTFTATIPEVTTFSRSLTEIQGIGFLAAVNQRAIPILAATTIEGLWPPGARSLRGRDFRHRHPGQLVSMIEAW